MAPRGLGQGGRGRYQEDDAGVTFAEREGRVCAMQHNLHTRLAQRW